MTFSSEPTFGSEFRREAIEGLLVQKSHLNQKEAYKSGFGAKPSAVMIPGSSDTRARARPRQSGSSGTWTTNLKVRTYAGLESCWGKRSVMTVKTLR